MPGLSREAQALQAQLTRRFIASLPDKRASFEQCWKEVQASSWSPEPLGQLRTLAHRLAGSAGSYGFENLGAIALRLDISLAEKADSEERRQVIMECTTNLIQALIETE